MATVVATVEKPCMSGTTIIVCSYIVDASMQYLHVYIQASECIKLWAEALIGHFFFQAKFQIYTGSCRSKLNSINAVLQQWNINE